MRTDHLLTSALQLPAASYGSKTAQSHFVRDLLSRLEHAPGMVSVAAAVETPPTGGTPTDFDINGISHTSTWKGIVSPCTRRYFDTVGLHLLAGRVPTIAEENNTRRVAVINQTMALQYFRQADPFGRRLALATFQPSANPNANSLFEVIGVVSDLKNNGTREAVLPEIYIPYTIGDFSSFRLYVRTIGNPDALATALTKQVLIQDPNVVPQETVSMDRILEVNEYARPRFGLVLLSTFASIGLILVIVGVYSVASYSVAQRHREIGIRMALGAKPLDIRSLVLRNSLSVLLLGIGIGVFLAFIATRLLANQIWGVSRYDPITFSAVIAILVSVGLLASYVPSSRAAHVDPAICLRSE
jgi:putative ABC transport system permease protein